MWYIGPQSSTMCQAVPEHLKCGWKLCLYLMLDEKQLEFKQLVWIDYYAMVKSKHLNNAQQKKN